MDAATAAIELTEVAWEQFIGAVLRAERFRALSATAHPRRRRRAPRPQRQAHTRGSLVWMLAVSAAGFLLLR
jgi:hypothetical protein